MDDDAVLKITDLSRFYLPAPADRPPSIVTPFLPFDQIVSHWQPGY